MSKLAKLIDLAFVLLGAQHPAWAVLAAGQWAVRRNAFLVRGLLLLIGVKHVTPLWVILFPAAEGMTFMSSAALVPAGAGTGAKPPSPGATEVVPAQQHQAEPPAPTIPAPTPTLQNKEQLIDHLAQIKLADGSYALSANGICKAVGGNEGMIKARVRLQRPEAEPISARPPASIRKPAGGW